MSSAAVFRALSEDGELRAAGITGNEIFSDYAAETVPCEGRFIILRWGDQMYQPEVRTGPTFLTVWVHQPDGMGSDFTEINRIHQIVRRVLTSLESELGEDGVVVSHIDFDGLGGSLTDPGFNTLTKNAGYRVLLRPVW